MSKESHKPAVIIAGSARLNFVWLAPWLKQIYFEPNGSIKPIANNTPCKI